MNVSLPRRAFAWYGDDFTGSTDVLEAVAPYLPSVLFLRKPSARVYAPFAEYSAFGLAGESRSQSPEWMDTHLPDEFTWLKSLQTAICHYKVCSTFDSSPNIGSIGRAAEIGKRVFSCATVPIVVGAPSLGRYTFFGNLFARAGQEVHRIDRHPAMSRHPVTPMHEADLRLHLREQTAMGIALLDLVQLAGPDAARRYVMLCNSSDAVLIDVVDEDSLRRAGQLLWDAPGRQPFVVGSSGAAYALLTYWKSQQFVSAEPASPGSLRPADRIAVLSGSCSPATQQQIQYAGAHGFTLAHLDPAAGDTAWQAACDSAIRALAESRSAVLYTSASPADRIQFASAGDRHALSIRAGEALTRVLNASGVRRVVVAGGDTSSHAGKLLNIDALTFLAPVAPGAPLCKAWSTDPKRQDVEMVFKGGQCGRDDFFEAVQNKEL